MDDAKSAKDILNIASTILVGIQTDKCVQTYKSELVDDFIKVAETSRYGVFNISKWEKLVQPLTDISVHEIMSSIYSIYDQLLSIGISKSDIETMLGVITDTLEEDVVEELHFKVSLLCEDEIDTHDDVRSCAEL